MRDEELNEAELEEDDAVGRQAALDKSAAIAVDMLDVCAINAPQSKNLMRVLVAPLLPAIEKLPEKSVFRKQLMLVFDIYVTYIMNMLFFLRLKADSLAKKNAVDKVLDSHPVLGKIEKFAEMIRIADAFVDKNSAALKKLNKKVSLGESIDALIVEPQVSRPCQQVKSENHEISIEEDQPKTSDHLSIEDRRKASKKIEKNTIVPFRRRKKKDPRIAKTKNRKRYKEAVKKVHSQIGTIRKEIQKYTGESRGIRISTVKSTKLIA
ncbi:Sas10 protein [Dictyocaulus viviparus]|uniref:Sas10 protein n=1 Tax=Dictyocaulus viviparus TaxID=29172 RepID=A0A0D8XHY4_DICVI|nr:Sas10 protein [Dictyocaulus viviparus]